MPVMISGPLVVNTLKSLIKLTGASSVLEIGMFTGYSALGMAEALPENGKIHTCEICPGHIQTAQKFFNKSPYKKMIITYEGDALKTLEKFPINTFDFIFIDADKINYINYYKKAMLLLKKGGVIILDNMLWSGNVIDPKDDDSMSLRKTGDFINEDKRVTNMLLPIRDGLMVCIKNEE